MRDLIFLAVVCVFFVLTFGLVELCRRLTEVS